MSNKQGRPFVAVAIAVIVLAVASAIPWGKATGGFLKDFNLLDQIMTGNKTTAPTASEPIDPDLAKALAEVEKAPETTETAVSTPVETDTVKAAVSPRVNGQVVIEDYTAAGAGPAALRRALSDGSRTARIAVVGDSYIEGDILTQDIREALQNKYGGSGVGYMPMQSLLTGFRTSVHQKCGGWKMTDIRKTKKDTYKWLAGEYCTAGEGAHTTFSGSKSHAHLGNWSKTQIVYVAPAGGNITVTTDAGDHTFTADSSTNVHSIVVPGTTVKAIVKATPGIVVLGAFLDGDGGVAVDNMSLRGNSGLSHRALNIGLAQQMRKFINYDMVVIEFGINALSSQQSNYNSYNKILQQIIARVRACYPGADILLMGIGDRGQKIDGDITSLPTSQAMVNAQRDAARKSGVLFWDTREAMGGPGAVVNWRNRGLINPDYIHLNTKGGAELSKLFVSALTKSLNE